MKTIGLEGIVYQIESAPSGALLLTPVPKAWPQLGDEVFIVTGSGRVELVVCHSNTSDYVAHFNAFRTEELAEKASKMMRLSNALISAKLAIEPDWEPNWRDGSRTKLCLTYTAHKWYVENTIYTNYNTPTYSTEAKALEAIKWLEERGVKP